MPSHRGDPLGRSQEPALQVLVGDRLLEDGPDAGVHRRGDDVGGELLGEQHEGRAGTTSDDVAHGLQDRHRAELLVDDDDLGVALGDELVEVGRGVGDVDDGEVLELVDPGPQLIARGLVGSGDQRTLDGVIAVRRRLSPSELDGR